MSFCAHARQTSDRKLRFNPESEISWSTVYTVVTVVSQRSKAAWPERRLHATEAGVARQRALTPTSRLRSPRKTSVAPVRHSQTLRC